MSQFVPKGYVGHDDMWKAAYLSMFEHPQDDHEVQAERAFAERKYPQLVDELVRAKKAIEEQHLVPKIVSDAPPPINPVGRRFLQPPPSLITKSKAGQVDASSGPTNDAPKQEIRRRELAAAKVNALISAEALEVVGRQWTDPFEFLWNNPYSAIARKRSDAARDRVLQLLFDGKLHAYCFVSFNASQRSLQQSSGGRIPEPLEALESGGFWLKTEGLDALKRGQAVWHFSKFDPPSDRRLMFLEAEIKKYLPATTAPKSTGPNKGTFAMEWLEKNLPIAKYPTAHHCMGWTMPELVGKISNAYGSDIGKGTVRNAIRDLGYNPK